MLKARVLFTYYRESYQHRLALQADVKTHACRVLRRYDWENRWDVQHVEIPNPPGHTLQQFAAVAVRHRVKDKAAEAQRTWLATAQ